MKQEGAGARILRRAIVASGAVARLLTGSAAVAMLIVGMFRERKRKRRQSLRATSPKGS